MIRMHTVSNCWKPKRKHGNQQPSQKRKVQRLSLWEYMPAAWKRHWASNGLRYSLICMETCSCESGMSVAMTSEHNVIELCGFAESCYSRFGASTMMDVINAGLDPHRWFAGVMNKVISPDLSKKDDPEWVAQLKAYLKEHVSDKQRQFAKAAWLRPGASGSDPCRIRK